MYLIRILFIHTIRKVKFLSKNSILTNPNIFKSIYPKFFGQFFSWNHSRQQLISPKPQHFREFFTPKKSTIFSGNQSWIFGQKMKISNSVKGRVWILAPKTLHPLNCLFGSRCSRWRIQESTTLRPKTFQIQEYGRTWGTGSCHRWLDSNWYNKTRKWPEITILVFYMVLGILNFVWKSLKMSHLNFFFCFFPPIFVLLKLTCLVTLFDTVSGFQKNWTIFGIFN